MSAWMVASLMTIGAAFMFVAGIGIWRFPDVYARMQAAAKAGTLGIGCLMGSVAVHFATVGIVADALFIVLFFFLTAPVATQRIGRAAHRVRVPLWEGTHRDELREISGVDAGALVAEDARPAEDDHTSEPPR